jgi:mono/diheme cytochrome c family protein
MRYLFPLLIAFAALAAPVDFRKDVEPVLKSRCQGCHGAAQQMSGLRLDSRDAALSVVVPGKSADSVLFHRITGAKGLRAMPPGPKRLSPEEIATLKTWIDEGATWPADAITQAPVKSTHWAFQPVSHPAVPKTSDDSWTRNPIDAFILARLDKDKIKPSAEADKRTLLRRVSLDLTGLPPTLEELREFTADTRPDAYERQVERLLDSSHFGEKWARHWLDRARYADSDGYEKDWARPFAWRYRDYVINAINADMPFDRFTIEQIAGDLLPNATAEQRAATGFHRNTLTNREGGIDNKQFLFESSLDRSNTVSTAWLGLTTGCAQCHNHKFDPISQKEHYQLMAFFDHLDEVDIDAPLPGELGPYLAKRDEYRAKRTALLKEYKVPELMPPWEEHMMRAEANPGKETDWDLAWDCLLKLTESGDGQKMIHIPPAKRTQREEDLLTDSFIRNYHFAVGPKVYEEVKFKELDTKLRDLASSYPQLTQAMAVVEEPGVHHSYLRVKGDYKALGVEVKPDVLAVLPPLKPADPTYATRLDLAKWIVSNENPLTPRVAVNWMWQELFGQAIVRTPNDFGTRGDPPSHPELLDWLASDFRDNGWSMKGTIRKIVTSSAYRQSSKERPELQTTDPANTLLARQSRVRLPAELVRDSALAVSGLLNTDVGGKSIFPPQPAGVAELGYGQHDSSGWKESTGRDRYRRGMYIFLKRSTPYPMLMNFDGPKTVQSLCKRDRSNTALQALNLLNDPVFMEAAAALAYESLSDGPAPFRQRAAEAFERSLGRQPSAKELDGLEKYFLREKAIVDKNPSAAAGRYVTLPGGVQPVEMAAWVAVSSVLLNLDEFITRE